MTSGHVNVTPLRVEGEIDLAALHGYFTDNPYDTQPGLGWGGMEEADQGAETVAFVRSYPGTPSLTNDAQGQLLTARLLLDRFNDRKAQQFPDELRRDLPVAVTHDLEAIDLVVYAANDTTVLLIGTHDAVTLDRMIPLLDTAIQAIAQPNMRLLSHLRTDPDLILWLIHRMISNAVLSPDLELLEVRYVRGSNTNNQRCDIRDSIGDDRAELLALVAQTQVTFRTVKLKLRYDRLGLEVDLLLNVDGSFSPYVGSSFYRDDPDSMSGVRLALDTARETIPALHAAHSSDAAWPTERARFRVDAVNGISQLLT